MNQRILSTAAIAAVSLLFAASCSTALAQASTPCSPPGGMQAGSNLVVTMKNGDVARGLVVANSSDSFTLNSASFGQIAVNLVDVCNLAGIAPGSSAPPTESVISPPAVPLAPPKIQLYGLEALTVSMGFTGSASRDQTYSAAPTMFAIEPKAKGRTLLNLSASYDDKWKATPNSSNVTQVYSGRLQQLFTVGASGAFVASGSAYRNNSQGIIVDQQYGVGGAKTFQFPNDRNSFLETDFDIRAIHDEMNAPGPTVSLVGSNLSINLSKCFPGPGMGAICHAPSASGPPARSSSIVVKAGVVPVFNRANSWQGYGSFDAFHPVTASWSVGLSAVDNYFEIAPKGFNKNYVKIGLSLKYTPQPPGPSGK